MSTDTILGIDLGTRFIGTAVMRSDSLVHCQIRAFQGPWSMKKLQAIILWIDASIGRYGVTNVSIKIPDVFPLSPGYNQLIGSFNVFCASKSIKPAFYSLSEIMAAHGKGKIETTDELMQILVRKHPELILEYRREKQNDNAHYHKLFAAVAVAHLK